jgi:DNA polymerase I
VLRRSVAVPFRKRDAESIRTIFGAEGLGQGRHDLPALPGVYEKVHQIDFTTFYPSIVLNYNLPSRP